MKVRTPTNKQTVALSLFSNLIIYFHKMYFSTTSLGLNRPRLVLDADYFPFTLKKQLLKFDLGLIHC